MNASRLSAHPWMQKAVRPVQSYFRAGSIDGGDADAD